MLASFLITLREGLEAFLLVGIILAYLRKLGAERYSDWIYAGVGAGLVASVGAAFVFQFVVSQFHSEYYRTLLMIVILLFAALVLSYMAVWMGKQAKAHTEEVKRQLEGYVSAGNVMGMVMLAFIAVLREGIETVLFFSALMYSGQGVTLQQGVIGALAGLAASIVLVWVLMRGTRRLPLQPFFRYSALLIVIIAAGLLGSSVNMMQSAELITVGTHPLFDISGILSDQGFIGTFLRALFGYNSSPTPVQFGAWALYLVIAITMWRRTYARPA